MSYRLQRTPDWTTGYKEDLFELQATKKSYELPATKTVQATKTYLSYKLQWVISYKNVVQATDYYEEQVVPQSRKKSVWATDCKENLFELQATKKTSL